MLLQSEIIRPEGPPGLSLSDTQRRLGVTERPGSRGTRQTPALFRKDPHSVGREEHSDLLAR